MLMDGWSWSTGFIGSATSRQRSRQQSQNTDSVWHRPILGHDCFFQPRLTPTPQMESKTNGLDPSIELDE